MDDRYLNEDALSAFILSTVTSVSTGRVQTNQAVYKFYNFSLTILDTFIGNKNLFLMFNKH